MLSDDGSIIYSFISYGAGNGYMYFISQSVSTGSVIGSRYKSSTNVRNVYGSILKGDYILVVTNVPMALIIFKLSTSTFIIKTTSIIFYEIGIEPSSGR